MTRRKSKIDEIDYENFKKKKSLKDNWEIKLNILRALIATKSKTMYHCSQIFLVHVYGVPLISNQLIKAKYKTEVSSLKKIHEQKGRILCHPCSLNYCNFNLLASAFSLEPNNEIQIANHEPYLKFNQFFLLYFKIT